VNWQDARTSWRSPPRPCAASSSITARGQARVKRGRDADQVSISQAEELAAAGQVDVLSLDESLARSPARAGGAAVVELRFFGDLLESEIAEVLEISDRTVRRHWNYAKAWLYRALNEDDGTRAQEE
jgi:DNA-directed RNA polymerase specialized sigma24 family protein